MQPDIVYQLEFPDGAVQRIPIFTTPEQREILVDDDFVPPDWARLDYHQCSHCTLDPATHAWCPIARNIAFLFPDTLAGQSFDQLTLRVTVPAREYANQTTLQRALGSLFGLICSLSPCPHTQPLRPMGIFHLPLATESETLIRACAFFLLRRYLEHLDDPSIDINLGTMEETYRNLKLLNKGLAGRLRGDSSDAAANAIVLLDIFARDVDFELGDQLEALRPFFY